MTHRLADKNSEPLKKKRKLPDLDESFSAESRPSDVPDLHQGRKRVQPHVSGQWAAHIYLDLNVEATMRTTMRKALECIKARRSTDREIHSLFGGSETSALAAGDEVRNSLHISLSRPLYLQTNQKRQLAAAVAKVATAFEGFRVRYATFAMLENEELSRRFLAIEVGQGYEEIKRIVEKLNLELVSMRLPPYYETPRFHTSIAWSSISPQDETDLRPFQAPDLEELDEKCGRLLRRDEVWAGELVLKMGKEITRYSLGE